MLPYQEKIATLIADVPKPPRQLESGPKVLRPYSAAVVADFTAEGYANNPKYATNDLFKTLTGTSHAAMVHNWVISNGIMTACNGLVGTLGQKMGAKEFLGAFELEATLKKLNKGHAFISADSGRRPNYGDLFRAQAYHMGVSLDFEGDNWNTIEAGQGGSKSGCDIVKFKQNPWNPSGLIGWCDMRIFLDPRPGIPDWLVGVWSIRCGEDTYTYKFTPYHEVFYYTLPPIGDVTGTTTPFETGEVNFQGSSDKFTIKWKTGGDETFWYERFNSVPGIMEKMSGETVQKLRPPSKGGGWAKPEPEKMTGVRL